MVSTVSVTLIQKGNKRFLIARDQIPKSSQSKGAVFLEARGSLFEGCLPQRKQSIVGDGTYSRLSRAIFKATQGRGVCSGWTQKQGEQSRLIILSRQWLFHNLNHGHLDTSGKRRAAGDWPRPCIIFVSITVCAHFCSSPSLPQ
jgi:hypothetical protein